MKNLFKRKKIIISTYFPPGELVKMIRINGHKFIRIAFTNRLKVADTWPITDIPWVHVKAIRVLPSAAEKFFYSLLGKSQEVNTWLLNIKLNNMNHTIMLTSLDDRTLYLTALQIMCFTRQNDNTTLIQLTNGQMLIVKTTAEKVESKLNQYMDDMLKFNLKLRDEL